MELEFIRVVAEEALAKMAHGNDLGDLFTAWCHHPITERQIVLHFAFFFPVFKLAHGVSRLLEAHISKETSSSPCQL